MIDSLFDVNGLDLLSGFHRLWVGLSGGLDSVVLLHHLAHFPQLKNRLSAVHIHHGLNVHADSWRSHCQALCDGLSIPLTVHQVEFNRICNIEEHARIARYQVFEALLGEHDALVLAHHQDDQAETVLLQLCRGAGITGLAAMPSVKPLGKGVLVRPLLHQTRVNLAAYSKTHQLAWIDDDSNEDLKFSRNYIRHEIMPLLRERWPGIANTLARTAQHCQQTQGNLEALARLDCDNLAMNQTTLSLACLKTTSSDRIANVLRFWLQNNGIKAPSMNTFNRLITEVVFSRDSASPCVEWDETIVRRYQQTLYILKKRPLFYQSVIRWFNFPEALRLENEVYLHAFTTADKGLLVPSGRDVQVRYRQGGEVFYWRGQTKKLKKLFQEWHVPPWIRDTVPLVYINGDLAAVVGFAIGDRYLGLDFNFTDNID